MIVIATAEPYGAYHLTPFSSTDLAEKAIHLIPHGDTTQGTSSIPVSSDRTILKDASLLVITGGSISEWTEELAREANSLNIPVVLSELAYTPDFTETAPDIKLAGITAGAPSGKRRYSHYLNVPEENITITGHPLLDDATDHTPAPKDYQRILLISSVGLPVGATTTLKEATIELGMITPDIHVRLHPREDHHLWTEYEVNHGTTLIEDLRNTDIVVGSPGTAYVAAAALNIPIVTLKEATHPQVPEELIAASKVCTIKTLLETVQTATATSPEIREDIVGPLGGSAQRMVAYWETIQHNQ